MTLPIGPVPVTDEQSQVKQNIAIQQLFKAFNALGEPLTNIRNAVTSNYTVLNTDFGKTIALGGSAFYTITFNASSGYDTDFMVIVLNEDTTRAKYIALNGTTPSVYLWPGQSVIVFAQSTQWRILGKTRWKLPTGALTINTDFSNGSDTLGVSDGLATGAGAFKTVEHALSTILNDFDFYGIEVNPTVITILMAAGSTDSALIHFSPHVTAIGAQGGAAIKIDGNGGAITGGMQFYFGSVIQIRNVTISSQTAGVHAIDMQWGSKLYILDGVTFAANAAGLAAINVAWGSHVELDNNITVSGAGSYLFIVAGGILQAALALTISITSNLIITNTVLVTTVGLADLANVTWSLGGHTVTATNKYVVSLNGLLGGSAAVPGSGAGSVGTGGQAY